MMSFGSARQTPIADLQGIERQARSYWRCVPARAKELVDLGASRIPWVGYSGLPYVRETV